MAAISWQEHQWPDAHPNLVLTSHITSPPRQMVARQVGAAGFVHRRFAPTLAHVDLGQHFDRNVLFQTKAGLNIVQAFVQYQRFPRRCGILQGLNHTPFYLERKRE